jgi:hypothetical protein
LEWSIENVAGSAFVGKESFIHSLTDNIQSFTAFLPDYKFVSLSGTVGCAIIFGIIWAFGSFGKLKRTVNNCEH